MKKFKVFNTLFLAIFLLTSCKNEPSITLDAMNGYWEIYKVEKEGNLIKEYTDNTVIDFFELTDSTGYRMKVQPLLDGSFKTSGDRKPFTISKKNKVYTLHYESNNVQWTETLMELSNSEIILRNKDNLSYFYKKYQQ